MNSLDVIQLFAEEEGLECRRDIYGLICGASNDVSDDTGTFKGRTLELYNGGLSKDYCVSLYYYSNYQNPCCEVQYSTVDLTNPRAMDIIKSFFLRIKDKQVVYISEKYKLRRV